VTSTEHSPSRRLAAVHVLGLSVLLVIGLVIVERLLGRQFVSDSGFGVWTGAWTRDTSQWMADPYTLTHVSHGVLFWWLLLPARARLSDGARFLIASLLEVLWEALENSPIIIDRYRTATAALDYYGDSILNSTFDLFAAMCGSWVAWRFDWKWALALVVAIDLACLVFARDNLALNILMLLYPLEAIKQWQLAQ
jgi:hypothetical protein